MLSLRSIDWDVEASHLFLFIFYLGALISLSYREPILGSYFRQILKPDKVIYLCFSQQWLEARARLPSDIFSHDLCDICQGAIFAF